MNIQDATTIMSIAHYIIISIINECETTSAIRFCLTIVDATCEYIC